MKTTPDLLFKQAYDLHYKCSDAEAALNVYQKVISEYPSSPEAGYAQTQIQNIEKNRDLLNKKHAQNKKIQHHKLLSQLRIQLMVFELFEHWKLLQPSAYLE